MEINNKNILNEIIEEADHRRDNGDKYGAIEDLLDALDRFPGNTKVELSLASHYIGIGDRENAVSTLEILVVKEPLREIVSRSLFFNLWRCGRVDDAYKELDRFFQSSGRYSEEYEVFLLSAMNRISEEEWDERMNAAERNRAERKQKENGS